MEERQWAKAERPIRHIIGHFGDGFYRSHSVKELKKAMQLVVKIRLQSHQDHTTMLQGINAEKTVSERSRNRMAPLCHNPV